MSTRQCRAGIREVKENAIVLFLPGSFTDGMDRSVEDAACLEVLAGNAFPFGRALKNEGVSVRFVDGTAGWDICGIVRFGHAAKIKMTINPPVDSITKVIKTFRSRISVIIVLLFSRAFSRVDSLSQHYVSLH